VEHPGADTDVPRETDPTRAGHGGERHGDGLDRISELIGVPITTAQRAALHTYEQWLVSEALPAGGIGPREGDRVFDRHIADSLMFLAPAQNPAMAQGAADGAGFVDVGSGVGLPGIPIAIVMPDTPMTLIDRSERRVHLAWRAVRVLELDNVVVTSDDVARTRGAFDVALFRASLTVEAATAAFLRMTIDDGRGLLAVSRGYGAPVVPRSPNGVVFDLHAEGTGVLDSPFWLLRMRRDPAAQTA
jgi:16S rRNA (guanine527-N7)-methyltransferase